MTSSLDEQHTRQHPAYAAGLALGTDIGTRQALDAICGEWAAQVEAAIVAGQDDHRGRPDGARHEYTAGRLLVVARIVAEPFGHVTHD